MRRTLVREAQSLPLGWRHLTQVDLAHIKHMVEEAAGQHDASLCQLEACLLLWASLTTGREAGQLATIHLQVLKIDKEPVRDGLYRTGRNWSWWLTAGVPKAQKRPAADFAPSLRPWARRVHLPATELVVLLTERCIGLRLADGEDIDDRSTKLFTQGSALVAAITRLLVARNPIGDGRARKAAATIEALARWLPAAIIDQPGGDAVPAAVISGCVDRVGRTPIHYGSVQQQDLQAQYRVAIACVDRLGDEIAPAHLAARVLGDRLTPTDEAVRQLVARLRRLLADARASRLERHTAMTSYTVALLAFAFAHRGDQGGLPSGAAIDPDTRFCWITDKVIAGSAVPRLVWVCDTALQQLHRYEAHLADLRASGITVPTVTDGTELPLFRLDAQGGLAPIILMDAMNQAVRDAGMMPRNAGRHWLRACLLGRCSSETLFALFGHGPLDEGSWGSGGGLDPVAYRADLARALDPLMREVGWAPCGPPTWTRP